ncbi:AGAP008186-PA [Anopheles gambiae str. PEST]|uniref:AGAP008186-PA n=1 Tax=Anopheles gambiae TaxID=7165 RepID=A7UUP3_ANOGA|nr:AGAP008186-PA [Anopheles gambiae str. PEST]
MSARPSTASFAQQQATDMLAAIIAQLPAVPSGELDEDAAGPQSTRTANHPSASVAAIQQSKRLAKLKQKLDRQNNFMVELKRKIREKEAMKPKADCDREELAFLRNRLKKEAELQHKLLADVIAEQRQEGANQWQSIPLCPDKLDEYCANPWTIGSVPVGEDRRFSIDSTLSALSSDELVGGEMPAGCTDAKLVERFEKELMNRDRVIEILQSRLDRLSADVHKVRRDNDTILDRHPKPVAPITPRFCETDMMQRLEFYRTNTETLGQNLEEMERALHTIQQELGPMGRESECPVKAAACAKPSHSVCEKSPARKSMSYSRPSKQYTMLLQEYTKKTTECRQLCERLAKAQAGPEDPTPEDTERELLKKRCSELLDEQDEFRVLIREQATQLDDYRARYLAAQQQVEEQRLQMSKLQVTNRRVEKQINFEIEQIKRKFQDKLRHLTPYPRLLEDEQAKAEQLKQSNETLFAELERSLRQVKTLEDRLHQVHVAKDTEVKQALLQSQTDLEQTQERLDVMAKEKQQVEVEAIRWQRELDELRTESAKIIERANQRVEKERETAQKRYSQLESELAQCRAEASFTIGNREQALREMHSQIKVLSSSFDDAQLQIRSLRNQLAYLQNEKLVCMA